VLSEDEVVDLFNTCSNVGRWGSADELGTLNYITPAKAASAAHGVRYGMTVSLGYDLNSLETKKNASPTVHRMLESDSAEPESTCDAVEISCHGFEVTHFDAIGHVFHDGNMYNGRNAAEYVTQVGMLANSIMALSRGVVTRGVLLDVARSRGAAWLEPSEGVTVEDLDTAEQMANVGVESGDALFVRVGLGAREAALGIEDPSARAGLDPSCLPWLHRREVAVFSGDCVDQIPSGYERIRLPLHEVGLAAMGLCLLDNTNMEALAEAVARFGKSDFLLCGAPLRIPGGTGSPVNPLAVF
jgi:kynurenine formamidase